MKNLKVKKFLSMALAVGMMGSMGGTVFASTNSVTTPYGIYGIVEDIGVFEQPQMSRINVFNTVVGLGANESFTSYQYYVSSAYDTVTAGVFFSDYYSNSSNSTFSIKLYGSNSIGGSRTLLGSATVKGSSNSAGVVADNNYTYYNFVVTNIGTSYAQAEVGISKDYTKGKHCYD